MTDLDPMKNNTIWVERWEEEFRMKIWEVNRPFHFSPHFDFTSLNMLFLILLIFNVFLIFDLVNIPIPKNLATSLKA